MDEEKIVVLSGAGISAESGIKTFRDQNGLWENHAIEDVATHEAFEKNPDLVHKFYNARKSQLLSDDVKPNAAHTALCKLQSANSPNNFLLVTQNVDNLHERAGSTCLHMHGELLQVRCENCNTVRQRENDLFSHSICSSCQLSGHLRPNIVWFGEVPFHMDEIFSALESADLFIAIGTSGLVYPAAQFVKHAKYNNKNSSRNSNERNNNGARCIEFNVDRTPISIDFDESIKGPASETVPEWVNSYLSQREFLGGFD